ARPLDGGHPGDGLDGQITNVAGQGAGNLPPEHRDLLVVEDQQPPQRGHPQGVGPSETELVQEPGAGHPEQVAHRPRTPCLASTAWTWALRPLRSATSLAR